MEGASREGLLPHTKEWLHQEQDQGGAEVGHRQEVKVRQTKRFLDLELRSMFELSFYYRDSCYVLVCSASKGLFAVLQG